MRPSQIWFQIFYRVRKKIRKLTGFEYKTTIARKGHNLKFDSWIEKRITYNEYIFEFLNQQYHMTNKIPWDETSFGRLWAYNLNYMDFLLQMDITRDQGIELIKDFIQFFPNNNIAKESYTISIRGINWIKFISGYQIQEDYIDNSLFAQYMILLDNIEYHLYGNHLIENAISLLFAGYYFRMYKLYQIAKKILFRELSEQVLSDGAHFEQSPMYHLIMLNSILNGINLLRNNIVFKDQSELQEFMSVKVAIMLGWINQICYRDGSIPLFNDSANLVAPGLDQINSYVKRLSLTETRISLGESGYRSINHDSYEMRLFIGNRTSSYITGHSHADTFNFEIYLRNEPLIVDTGISTYEKNERRQFERSTAAHNTVQVHHRDSSQVWGGFRMARRASVFNIFENEQTIEAMHNGYSSLGIIHKRTFRFDCDKIGIYDYLIGRSDAEGTARFHFHPKFRPEILNNEIHFQGGSVIITGANKITLSEYNYAPEYNKLILASVVEVLFKNSYNWIISFS